MKRGVNDKGRVANDVEIEQIVVDETGSGPGYERISSVVQVRGSIPLFWSQEASRLNAKPDIHRKPIRASPLWLILSCSYPFIFSGRDRVLICFFILCITVRRYDPMYVSTKLHFEDLENRYGNPITILNLIKVKLSFQLLLDPIF